MLRQVQSHLLCHGQSAATTRKCSIGIGSSIGGFFHPFDEKADYDKTPYPIDLTICLATDTYDDDWHTRRFGPREQLEVHTTKASAYVLHAKQHYCSQMTGTTSVPSDMSDEISKIP